MSMVVLTTRLNMLVWSGLAISRIFTLAHCWHFYLAVDWVRDKPARGKGLMNMRLVLSKTLVTLMSIIFILNLDASWSSSSILLHMLTKLVSSSEGCRGRLVSIFMIKVHVRVCTWTKLEVELRTIS